ncbi:hypothetical protein ALT785_640013 [Alteromonas infernus]
MSSTKSNDLIKSQYYNVKLPLLNLGYFDIKANYPIVYNFMKN